MLSGKQRAEAWVTDSWKLAQEYAAKRAPAPNIEPHIAGVYGAVFSAMVVGLFEALSGRLYESDWLIEIAVLAFGFAIPFLIVREQWQNHTKILKAEYARLEAEDADNA